MATISSTVSVRASCRSVSRSRRWSIVGLRSAWFGIGATPPVFSVDDLRVRQAAELFIVLATWLSARAVLARVVITSDNEYYVNFSIRCQVAVGQPLPNRQLQAKKRPGPR